MATGAIANQIFGQLRDGRCAAETATYVAVPGNEMARWLLPAKSPEIGRVLASWAPYRLWSRVAWRAVCAASGLARVADIPGVSVLEVEGTRNADWESMGWRGGEPPIPVIYLGTPGARRKAVVHLVDRTSGLCKAVVKVPLTEEAKAAIRREAEVLEALATEGHECSPRLLHVDWARGITTQTFVEGRPGSRRLTPDCWRLLRSLLLPGETTTLAEHAENWEREIKQAGEDSADNRNVAAAIDELRDDYRLPACWEHGDFTPWNIKQLPGGGCVLLDWEDAQRRGLPLQDAYHFLHMQDWLFGGRPKLHAAEIWKGAAEIGLACARDNSNVPTGLELCSHSTQHSACGYVLGSTQPPQGGWFPDNPSSNSRAKLIRTDTLQLQQVHRLEAAYLVRSLLKCVREQNYERARFLIGTLALQRRKAA
jgi:hypothetical protein